VLLFGIAGWESAKHGYDALTHGGGHGPTAGEAVQFLWLSYTPPAWLDPIWVNYAVLGGAFVFESWALYKANQGITAQMDERGWDSYREAFRKTSDVTTLTALTEDTIALAGIVLAFLGVFLTQFTGDPMYDAASAFLIGLLLMGFALALAWENKRLILGESLPVARETTLRDVIRNHEGVADVVDFRTVYFGPEELLVATDVTFRDGLETDEIDRLVDDIEDALREQDAHVAKVYVEPEQ